MNAEIRNIYSLKRDSDGAKFKHGDIVMSSKNKSNTKFVIDFFYLDYEGDIRAETMEGYIGDSFKLKYLTKVGVKLAISNYFSYIKIVLKPKGY